MQQVAHYRVYNLGAGDRIVGVTEILCETDEQAVSEARTLLERRPIEVWHCGRKLARFQPEHRTA